MNKEKLFFKISELEELTGITSTKIRYWTKKYRELNSQLRETPNSTHKLYHKDSIEIIITIDKYVNGYTFFGIYKKGQSSVDISTSKKLSLNFQEFCQR